VDSPDNSTFYNLAPKSGWELQNLIGNVKEVFSSPTYLCRVAGWYIFIPKIPNLGII
jgi:hypothetical protein